MKQTDEKGNPLTYWGGLAESKQKTLLGKTISKEDADKDLFEDVTKYKIERSYSEEEMLKMLHKFGFDYTYNYKGEKTIYEWIPEWFEEYKRLLTI
jgi:hypothetical protein